jgi:hypothetical protein
MGMYVFDVIFSVVQEENIFDAVLHADGLLSDFIKYNTLWL